MYINQTTQSPELGIKTNSSVSEVQYEQRGNAIITVHVGRNTRWETVSNGTGNHKKRTRVTPRGKYSNQKCVGSSAVT
jgi:hypothetical protein